jgi:hypothetical protein
MVKPPTGAVALKYFRRYGEAWKIWIIHPRQSWRTDYGGAQSLPGRIQERGTSFVSAADGRVSIEMVLAYRAADGKKVKFPLGKSNPFEVINRISYLGFIDIDAMKIGANSACLVISNSL